MSEAPLNLLSKPTCSHPASHPPAQQTKENPQPVQPFRLSGCPTPPTRLLGPAKTFSMRANPFRPAAIAQAAAPKGSPRRGGNGPSQVAVGADVRLLAVGGRLPWKLGRPACSSSAGRVANQRLPCERTNEPRVEEQSRWVVFRAAWCVTSGPAEFVYLAGAAFHLQWSDMVSGPRPPPLLWARIYTSCERSPLLAFPPDETVAELGRPTLARRGDPHARLFAA